MLIPKVEITEALTLTVDNITTLKMKDLITVDNANQFKSRYIKVDITNYVPGSSFYFEQDGLYIATALSHYIEMLLRKRFVKESLDKARNRGTQYQIRRLEEEFSSLSARVDTLSNQSIIYSLVPRRAIDPVNKTVYTTSFYAALFNNLATVNKSNEKFTLRGLFRGDSVILAKLDEEIEKIETGILYKVDLDKTSTLTIQETIARNIVYSRKAISTISEELSKLFMMEEQSMSDYFDIVAQTRAKLYQLSIEVDHQTEDVLSRRDVLHNFGDIYSYIYNEILPADLILSDAREVNILRVRGTAPNVGSILTATQLVSMMIGEQANLVSESDGYIFKTQDYELLLENNFTSSSLALLGKAHLRRIRLLLQVLCGIIYSTSRIDKTSSYITFNMRDIVRFFHPEVRDEQA